MTVRVWFMKLSKRFRTPKIRASRIPLGRRSLSDESVECDSSRLTGTADLAALCVTDVEDK